MKAAALAGTAPVGVGAPGNGFAPVGRDAVPSVVEMCLREHLFCNKVSIIWKEDPGKENLGESARRVSFCPLQDKGVC